MRPQLLEIENFLAFGKARVDLSALHGLVLLSGEHRGSDMGADSNGAGKSALIDALCWALYGKMARPKHRAEDVVRRATGADTMVRLAFEDTHGRLVEVRRCRKHRKFKDGLHLEIDGADARGASVADTQQRIDELVGIDHDTFVGSVLYTQHPLRGRFAELSDDQKKELLESILGVEVLSRARELAKKDLRAREAALARIEGRCRALAEQIAWLERQRDEQTGRAATWASDHAARLASMEARRLALVVEAEAHAAREPLLGAPVELRLADEARVAWQDADRLARKTDGTFERRLAGARSEESAAVALLRHLREDVARFDVLGDTCPVCTQRIAPEVRAIHLTSVEEQIAEQASRVLAARRILAEIAAERQIAQEEAARISDRLETRAREASAKAEAGRLACAQQAGWLRERDVLRRREVELRGQHEALVAEQNAHEELAERAANECRTKSAELEAADLERARIVAERDRLAFWDEGFGPRGLKSYLLDTVLPILNARARFHGELLTGGALSVQFSTVTEKDGDLEDRFSIQITHRSGVDSYALLSGGERQRVNLIINLALQDLVASRAARPLPFAIYDEAFEGLDRTGVEAAVAVLAEAARSKDLVLVVTHQDALRDLFAHELRVVCERGGSFVETVS